MPLYGTLDVKSRLDGTPLVTRPATEPWAVPGVSVLNLIFEMDEGAMLSALPPALHPTIPPTLHFVFVRAPESSVGPFTLALVRIGCRASAFQRGFVTRAYCESEAATRELRERYAFDVRPARVHLTRRHDRVVGEVDLDGRAILACELIDPIAIGADDVRYIDSLNLARVPRGGAPVPRLLQVDPAWTIKTVDRGRPHAIAFDPDAWSAPGVRPNYPVSASIATADVVFPKLRFAIDPDKPAHLGSEAL
jgi:hypothetical protein